MRLFEGEFENYIECIDVDYRSQRNETFYDLQLNVKDESGAVITSLEARFAGLRLLSSSKRG